MGDNMQHVVKIPSIYTCTDKILSPDVLYSVITRYQKTTRTAVSFTLLHFVYECILVFSLFPFLEKNIQ